MRKHFTRILAVASLCIVMLANTASASHYIWQIFNSGKQLGFTGVENRLSWWLANGTLIFIWGDTTSDGPMTTATNNWNAKIPQVMFHKVTSESSADVTYKAGTCPGGSLGCHGVVSVYTDTDRNVNWNLTSAIVMDTSQLNTNDKRVYTLAHETGHHLGMDEQYLESSGGCNSNVVSIMDGLLCDTENGSTLLGPSNTDKFRVDNFLGSGYIQNLAVSVSGSKATVTWKDYAAGELHHLVTVKKSDGTTATTSQVTKDIGLRAGLGWTADRTIQHVFDRVALGLPAGNYSFCVKPWFKSYNQYGVEDCSSSYYVP